LKRPGALAYAAASLCFVIFSANVVLGASGAGTYLGDIAEMLVLFAAVIFFVVGILASEAAENPEAV
jgi:hypothetical protein